MDPISVGLSVLTIGIIVIIIGFTGMACYKMYKRCNCCKQNSVSQELNNYETAAKSYKKAIKINTEDILSHYNLGISYLALGKKREAIKKLDILYMLDRNLYDSLSVRINSF